jgi:hypothetical protein|tara:strand:- start:3218 stop:3442 length:225 start_codon:yes stop_codon:yes gene_type:complete
VLVRTYAVYHGLYGRINQLAIFNYADIILANNPFLNEQTAQSESSRALMFDVVDVERAVTEVIGIGVDRSRRAG